VWFLGWDKWSSEEASSLDVIGGVTSPLDEHVLSGTI
jgi:hypothetical protein